MQDSAWELFHHYLRKTGHFIGYGTVGFTFLRAWLHTLSQRGRTALVAWRLESCILAILSTAIVASGDEFHQCFIPGRTGRCLGCVARHLRRAACCVVVWLICWSRRTQPLLELHGPNSSVEASIQRHRIEAVPQPKPNRSYSRTASRFASVTVNVIALNPRFRRGSAQQRSISLPSPLPR